MIFKTRAKDVFNVQPITSTAMEDMIAKCARIYQGMPEWLDEEDNVKTINFAKAVCSETARLAMLGTKITVDGSARAEFLQEKVDNLYYSLREWVEYGCAFGTVILKPNGDGVDIITPDNFIVTEKDNGKITGVIFVHQLLDESGKRVYTRLEYHRYIGELYAITNRCFVGESANSDGRPIAIENTPWEGMMEEAFIENVESPLYGVLRMPHANNIDLDSPMGLPIFSDAIEELQDLDVAYSRNANEIFDSERIVLLDSDRLIPSGGKVANTTAHFEHTRKQMKLPKYVKNVYGNGQEDFYQEINPNLNTDVRLSGLNALLSQIGYKIGFSNGYFVFNESGGLQTATEVESDDRRTLQFIKDVRDRVEACLTDLIYAENVMADIYDLAPVGEYEVVFDFGDITYNVDEDRTRWWGYVIAGKVPAWMYFVKFEGMSEDEAKAMIAEAQPKEAGLFGSEE